MTEPPDAPKKKRRSIFVTILGWFCCIAGTISVPIQLIICLDLLRERSPVVREATHDAIVEVFGGADMHPLTRFWIENLGILSGVQLLAVALLLAVGVGLVRRRRWALPLGALFLSIGVVRQLAALAISTSSHPARGPGISAAFAKEMAPVLSGLTVLSLAWSAFLVWKFRRPEIREEFLQ